MNIYEKRLLQVIQRVSGIILVTVLLNLFLPIVTPSKAGYSLFLQWLVVACYGYTYLLATGRKLNGVVPIAQLLFLRVIQVVWSFIFTDLVWVSFGILLIFDFLVFTYLMFIRSKYEWYKHPKRRDV